MAPLTTKTLLEKHLGLQQMNAVWVPHLLTDAQKEARVELVRSLLTNWEHRWSSLISKLIAVDKTWISYSSPLTRLSGALMALSRRRSRVSRQIAGR